MRILDDLRQMKPTREAAEQFMASFSQEEWRKNIRRVFGQAAETVIAQSEREDRNSAAKHAVRLKNTLDNWDTILKICEEELPPTDIIASLMENLGMPMYPSDIDVTTQDTRDALDYSRDIRDKFLTSTLLWDLGLLYTWELPRTVR